MISTKLLIDLQVSWKYDVPLKPESTRRHAREVTFTPVKSTKDTEVFCISLHFILKLNNFYFNTGDLEA